MNKEAEYGSEGAYGEEEEEYHEEAALEEE